MLARGVLTVAIIAIALTGLLLLATRPEPPAPAPVAAPSAPGLLRPEGEQATIVGVADAVTFDVRLPGREVVRVRALGVQPPGECYAEEGTVFARRVLGPVSLRLVPDPAGPPVDRFDRRLAHVMVGDTDYAALAAEAGVVRTYTAGASESTMPPIRDAEQRARDAGRGLWAPPCA